MPHNTARKKNLLKKHNLSGVNKPKRTPKHPTKSHIVLAQEGHQLKLIRFGQQGAKTAGKNKMQSLRLKENLLKLDMQKILKKEKCLLLTGQTKLNGRH